MGMRSNGRNGNILCDITHLNLEEAQIYCNMFNCDAIITNGYRWEAVNLVSSANACQRSSQVNVQVVFNRNSNNGRKKRSESQIIHTSRVIEDHGPTAFKQFETHFKEANVTVYNVDPHLKYERNYQVDFHNEKKSVGITPTQCLLLFQETKYNLDTIDTTKVTNENVKTRNLNVQFTSSNDSIFKSKFVSFLCEGKHLLEEDFITDSQGDATIFTITDTDKIKRVSDVPSRSPRSPKQCKASNCSKGIHALYTMCNTENCSGGWCLYMEDGTIGTSFKTFDHIRVTNMWCMPCCIYGDSAYYRMPKYSQITKVGLLCTWYKSKGRCGDEFGKN